MVRSGLETLGLGLVVLAMCVVLAQPAEVVTLEEDLALEATRPPPNTTTPQPQASNASQPVSGLSQAANITTVDIQKRQATELPPITPELQSYMVKVTDVLKEEGKDIEQHDIEGLARNLMLVDHAEKDSPRMREIARSLRTDGPKVHRVEVDPKTYKSDKQIRLKEEKAKRAETARQEKMARRAKTAKKKEARRAKQLIGKYKRQTFNPALAKQIQAAKEEVTVAHDHMTRTYTDAVNFDASDHPHKPKDEPSDEYGIFDDKQHLWGAPAAPVKQKSVQQESAAAGTTPAPSAGGKGEKGM